MIVEGFNNNDILPSSHIGLTPQLLEFDALTRRRSECGPELDLMAGDTITAAPGKMVSYKWYAGRMTIKN